MAIPLPCSCGKTLKVKEELAGKRIKCPACSAVLHVPEPELAAVEAATTDAPEDLTDERPADAPKKKKKKKKKKKDPLALTEKELKDQEFERETERRQFIQRMFRSTGYVVLGAIITIGAIYCIFAFWDTIFTELQYGALVILIFFVGLAAIGKGILGLVFGQDTD